MFVSEQPPILFLGEWSRGACCAQRLARDAFTMEKGRRRLRLVGIVAGSRLCRGGCTCKQVEVSVDRRPGEHMAIVHGPAKSLQAILRMGGRGSSWNLYVRALPSE